MFRGFFGIIVWFNGILRLNLMLLLWLQFKEPVKDVIILAHNRSCYHPTNLRLKTAF